MVFIDFAAPVGSDWKLLMLDETALEALETVLAIELQASILL